MKNGDGWVGDEIFEFRNNSESQRGFPCRMRKVWCPHNLQKEVREKSDYWNLKMFEPQYQVSVSSVLTQERSMCLHSFIWTLQ